MNLYNTWHDQDRRSVLNYFKGTHGKPCPLLGWLHNMATANNSRGSSYFVTVTLVSLVAGLTHESESSGRQCVMVQWKNELQAVVAVTVTAVSHTLHASDGLLDLIDKVTACASHAAVHIRGARVPGRGDTASGIFHVDSWNRVGSPLQHSEPSITHDMLHAT